MEYFSFLGQEPMFVQNRLSQFRENVIIEETLDPHASRNDRVAKVIRIKEEAQETKILVGFFQRPHI